ncbi:MAG: hypothetical protein IJ748_06055 [Bacteroidales bacterium]|nr:hypothetical protein [Bacteroidales bacterium]
MLRREMIKSISVALILASICLLILFSCKKDPSQEKEKKIKSEKIMRPDGISESRFTFDDTLLCYKVDISTPIVLKKRDSLDLQPVVNVCKEYSQPFIDSIHKRKEQILNSPERKREKEYSHFVFRLTKAEEKNDEMCFVFSKKVYFPGDKDTCKSQVKIRYNYIKKEIISNEEQ